MQTAVFCRRKHTCRCGRRHLANFISPHDPSTLRSCSQSAHSFARFRRNGNMTSGRHVKTTRGDFLLPLAGAHDAIRRRISGLSSVSGHEFTRRATNRATTPDARTARVNANSTRALFPARRRAFFPFRSHHRARFSFS